MTNNRGIVGMVAAALLAACADRGQPVAPTAAPTPAAMALVSGDNQEGKAGDRLDAPFVVRVVDSRGDGIPNIEVTWSVTSGAGHFGHSRSMTTISARTVFAGRAESTFRPTALGPSTVTASLARAPIPPVTFTANATVTMISISPWFVGFFGPESHTDVAVPVGTTVEWRNDSADSGEEHIVTSIATPPGGTSFRSPRLTLGDEFQFVPHVRGTWEYVCELHASEEAGTLTAR